MVFLVYKLSLNAKTKRKTTKRKKKQKNKKTKYVSFHKVSMCDSLPLQQPTITSKLKEKIVKFIGVIIDEKLTWENHIEVVENNISKNIVVLYRVSHLLGFKNLKIYFPFIYIYISYANLLGLVLLKLNSRES